METDDVAMDTDGVTMAIVVGVAMVTAEDFDVAMVGVRGCDVVIVTAIGRDAELVDAVSIDGEFKGDRVGTSLEAVICSPGGGGGGISADASSLCTVS